MRALVAAGRCDMGAFDRDRIDRLADAETNFISGATSLPFTGRDFLLSFSQPNFHFHYATAYAILRMRGMPLGKGDYLGRLRVNSD